MKLSTTLLSITLLGAAAGLAALVSPEPQATDTSAPPAEAYEMDPVHSTVIFKIKHLGVSYFYGRFNGPTGSFTFDPETGSAGSIEIVLETAKIDTGNGRRDGHLKSADFFNAKQFPKVTFKSTDVRKVGDKLQVRGELTMHGVSKPLSLELEHVGCGQDPWGGYRCGFDAMFTVSRSDFGINYMPGGLGDEVTVMVGLEGIRK